MRRPAKVNEIDIRIVKLSSQKVCTHSTEFLGMIPKKKWECFEQFLGLFQCEVGVLIKSFQLLTVLRCI
ncbi:MAG: hypothetical protein RL106_1219 [Bacteroidota bacterium]